MSKSDDDDWFVGWFDSPYYDLLYQHRDENEARTFVQAVLEYLELPAGSKVLDLACGKGRHSIEFHKAGMVVKGLDLSACSIAAAKSNEKQGLSFVLQDMRHIDLDTRFDAAFNLFTSFGYFENTDDNLLVLKGLFAHLNPEGYLIIDYLNCTVAARKAMGEAEFSAGNCVIRINKEKIGSFIRKSIDVDDDGQHFHFEERVQLLFKEDFESMLSSVGFVVISTFGGYDLSAFDAESSERLIIVAKKK